MRSRVRRVKGRCVGRSREHPNLANGERQRVNGRAVGERAIRGGREDGRSPATPPVPGATNLARGSALAPQCSLRLADQGVAGGFPLDVPLAGPGKVASEHRVHDADVVALDVVLGRLAGGEVVALDRLAGREAVALDVVLGRLAGGEVVALDRLAGREAVALDVVLGRLAGGEVVALDCLTCARHLRTSWPGSSSSPAACAAQDAPAR